MSNANYNIHINQRSLPINILRGDSVNLIFLIDLSYWPIAPNWLPCAHYRLKDDDKLYIGIMEPNKLFECAIVKKILTADTLTTKLGDPILTLSLDDTQYLLPGTYYLMAKLLLVDDQENETITTVIPITRLNIV